MNPNTLHEVSTLLSTVSALLSSAAPAAAMIPAHQNTSNEGEKTEVPEIVTPAAYVAPGTQYGNAREALAHMLHELRNPERDSYNETLDFTYAKLPQLLDMLRDPIYQHGLMLNQELKTGTNGLPFDMVTTFHHIPTNTEVSFSLPAYIKEDKRLDDCQRVGASYTYFRRYGLRQALGITDGDDDADQAEAKRQRRGKRSTPAQPDALHDEVMQCLPDVTAPGWREAEAKAIALGATPYTEEQIAQAFENARTFRKLTPEEIQFLNATFEHLSGDYSSVDPLWQKHKTTLDQRARTGDIRIIDQEDLSRGYFRCWLLAAQEFAGVAVSVLCEDDEPEQDITPAVADDLPPEELERLKQKRDARLTGIRAGTVPNSYGDDKDDAVCDALYAQVKSDLSPQPPVRREYVDAPEKPLVTIPESDIPY